MVALDMDLNTSSSGAFDTYESAEAGTALRDFVTAIPNNSYFIGVSADTAMGDPTMPFFLPIT